MEQSRKMFSFSSRAGISSGPVALVTSRASSTVWTSFAENDNSVTVGFEVTLVLSSERLSVVNTDVK